MYVRKAYSQPQAPKHFTTNNDAVVPPVGLHSALAWASS